MSGNKWLLVVSGAVVLGAVVGYWALFVSHAMGGAEFSARLFASIGAAVTVPALLLLAAVLAASLDHRKTALKLYLCAAITLLLALPLALFLVGRAG